MTYLQEASAGCFVRARQLVLLLGCAAGGWLTPGAAWAAGAERPMRSDGGCGASKSPREWDLRSSAPRPCKSHEAAVRLPAERPPVSFFNLPANGLALKVGAHVMAAGDGLPSRGGISIEPGIAYFFQDQRYEAGVSAQVAWLWGEESSFFRTASIPSREFLDFLLVPRLHGSVGFDSEGFVRFHASVGYGPTLLRASATRAPPRPHSMQTTWSYTLGAGLSVGLFHFEVQSLGYMYRSAGTDVIIAPPGDTAAPTVVHRSEDVGIAVSIGVLVPLPL